MTDYFALFNIPRSPSIDLDLLKKTFLAQSSQVHPDRFHNATAGEKAEAHASYTTFNQAYQCLKDSKNRLLHLIKLESGKEPPEVMSIPHETTELFMEVGSICRQVDEFLKEGQAINSPLLKVAWFEDSLLWTEKLQATQEKINQWKTSLEEQLTTLSARWATAPAMGDSNRLAHLPLVKLEQLYRVLSYVSRWSAQLQERNFRLTSAMVL
jgi:hypothetical protein